jgi:phosphoglycerol transferase MdoB-like AlkP superfamily enzyme
MIQEKNLFPGEMIKRLKALGSYAIFWLMFFIVARLIFIISQFRSAFPNRIGDVLGTFTHGAALDISTTGYYLLLPVFLAIPGIWFKGNWYRYFMRFYSWFLIVFSSIIVISDASLYSYWGFRMDYTPILYLKTPGEAMASVSTLKSIVFVLSITFLSAVFIYLYNRFIDNRFEGFGRVRIRLAGTLSFMLLWGALVIPIRGGFGVAPINAGSVYFSQNMFLNHTAVNAVWNVGTSAFTQKPVKNPYLFGERAVAESIVDSLTVKGRVTTQIVKNSQPNVLFIVLESFSGYLIGPLGGDSLATPNFNRYIKEGVLFTNFYASGNRTDKAIPAILNGYPAQPAQSIIKEPRKTQSLPSIVKTLTASGYNSSFWYGGEINFANFNSFVIGSGFQEIVTKDNFNPADYNSKWGVHDHVLFNVLQDSMKKMKEPFLKVVLTLSSHEPFDVPGEPVFEGSDVYTKYRNSVHYADEALGKYLDWAKTTDWWKNTLVILVADHCCRISAEEPLYTINLFRIPMLWIGGALSEHPSEVAKTGSQVDIPVTLMNQLGIENNFRFGKDLLSDTSESFAFYTYNEGFAFITDSSKVIYDQKLKEPILFEGAGAAIAEKYGKAYLQVLFDDYLKR